MVELILGSLVKLGTKLSGTGERKTVGDESHPEVGLLVVGGPMVHVRDVYKTGRVRGGGVEHAFLAVEGGEVAGDPIGPLAGFGGGEAYNHFVPAGIPKARHEISFETWRTELGLESDGGIGIQMGCGVAG